MTTQEALALIAAAFDQPPELIAAETRRDQIPGWDSLGTLVLIATFDEKFDIQLSDKDLDPVQRVDDVLEILRLQGKLARE